MGANDCTSVDDTVFAGLTVVQVAREDPRDKRPLRGALSRETTSLAAQWVPYTLMGLVVALAE